jgi:hypothetical protein
VKDVIVIDGVEYVRKDLAIDTDGDVKIIVLPHGWVMVGVLKFTGERDEWCRLSQCANIRRWGTSMGLGEIAINGPTGSTVLDKSPPVSVMASSIIKIIDCVADRWEVLR